MLSYVDILQSDITGITHRLISKNSLITLKNGKQVNLEYSILMQKIGGKDRAIFRLDKPHIKDGKMLGYHINYDGAASKYIVNSLDHREISEAMYLRFRNFQKIGKVVRIGGKVLLVAGILLDTMELGNTVIDDLNDADKKIGKKTGMAAAEIGSRWAGATIGAKLGAMAGSGIGTAVAPGLGTAIGGAVLGLAGGIAGAVGGEEFANWVFDITDLV